MHHPNSSKHRTCWRQVNNATPTCKASILATAAPSRLSPYIEIFTHLQKMCQLSVYVFHTSSNPSKALALPLPQSITSSQMSCIWGSCASSCEKYSIPLPATGPLAFLNPHEAPSAKRNNVIYNGSWSETLHLRRCSSLFLITHSCQNQICWQLSKKQ